MTQLDQPAAEVLLARVRAGDTAAFERLYADHVDSAHRLATLLAGPDGADDLVVESFARILDALKSGGGPTENFRAYLHASIRNRHRDNLRAARERPSSDMPWLLDAEDTPPEDLVASVDANGAVAALASLPSTWQRVMWYLEVEGRKPADIADLLDLSPVAISSLAYRAREGLRQAYLDQQLERLPAQGDGCGWARPRLSKYVREALSPRATAKIDKHLAGCTSCAAAVAELREVNHKFAALVIPIVLIGGMAAIDAQATSGGSSEPTSEPEAGAEASGAATDAAPGMSSGAASSTVAGVAAAAGGAAALGAVAALRRRRGGLLRLPGFVIAAAVGVFVIAASAVAWALVGGADRNGSIEAIAGPIGAAPFDVPRRMSADIDWPPYAAAPAPSPAPSPTPSASPSPTIPPGVVPVASPSPSSPSPSNTPTPEPVKVRPKAPVAVKITDCGLYGSVTFPKVSGVKYALTKGDGKQGAWAATAKATKGHVLAANARSHFSGDLGTHVVCPSIGDLTKVSQGDPLADPWDITVTPVVPKDKAQTIEIVYTFDTGVIIDSRSGAGWTCREPSGTEVGAGSQYYFPDPATPFTCTFDYTGTSPPPVTLSVSGDQGGAVANPTGKVDLSSGGVVRDTRTFS